MQTFMNSFNQNNYHIRIMRKIGFRSSFNPLVPDVKGHAYLNKSAAESCKFV